MLIPLFARDPRLLGVLGLDRSVTQVQKAIAMFEAHGIPMVATTLSADGIGAGDTYYFQMSQSNSQEAALMLRYIRDVVPAYFAQPRKVYNSGGKIRATRILIYRPSSPDPNDPSSPDPNDLYISTLVRDLQREAPRFTGLPPPRITSQLGNSLCGPSTVDVYAGRHDMPPGNNYDTFTQFLQTIASDCAATDEPFIIADDGVTRFIADPAKRDQPGLGNAAVSYVTKGIAIMRTGAACLSKVTAAKVHGGLQEFCQTYADIVNGLSGLPEQQGQQITFLWTGERVGLAYDVARLFFQAELNYEGSNNKPVTRAAIPGEFETHPYHGVTGSLSFTANSHITADTPQGMPLTIVRIQLSSPTAVPTCEYPGEGGHPFGPGPNPGACPSGSA
jgi:hypothetical protein